MFAHLRTRRLRVLALAGVLVGALALPTAVFADTTGGPPPIPPTYSRDATITGVSVGTTARLIANVTISYVCQPFQSYDWSTGQVVETTVGRIEDGGAVILQAQGKTIDWGQGYLFGGSAVCDGTTVNQASTTVSAMVSPWKQGSAVVSATINVSDANGSDWDYASSGPITVKLSGK